METEVDERISRQRVRVALRAQQLAEAKAELLRLEHPEPWFAPRDGALLEQAASKLKRAAGIVSRWEELSQDSAQAEQAFDLIDQAKRLLSRIGVSD